MNNITLKIGQIIKVPRDYELEGYFGTTRTIKASTQAWIGIDGTIRHLNGTIETPADGEFKVSGYDNEGLAQRILWQLKKDLPLREILEDYELTEKDVTDAIEWALDDILGF